MNLEISSIEAFLAPSETKLILDSLSALAFHQSVTTSPVTNPQPSLTSSSHISLPSIDSCLDSLIVDRISLHLGWPSERLEPLHLVRYLPGQEYKPHHDDFPPIMFYKPDVSRVSRLHTAGNRVSTALVYLNDDFQGGSTYFPHLSLSILPKSGMLIAWDNLFPDGSRNPAALHAGEPVISGTKYLIPVHLREKPYY